MELHQLYREVPASRFVCSPLDEGAFADADRFLGNAYGLSLEKKDGMVYARMAAYPGSVTSEIIRELQVRFGFILQPAGCEFS